MQTITPAPSQTGESPAGAAVSPLIPLRLSSTPETRLMLTFRERPIFLLWPEDGWLTFLLLSFCVYITVLSIESMTPPWAPGLQILSLTTLLGLVFGLLAALQRIVPRTAIHIGAAIVGCLFAFQQTAHAVLRGNQGLLLAHLRLWLDQAIHDQPSNDNTIFLLFLAVLSFLLAYVSVWLVQHSRRPLLAIIANGVVLLINLDFASENELIFLIFFLLGALLLLVRFSLADNMRQWRARGLRFSPDLSWDVMQAGAIFAVLILLLAAYVLPAGAANPAISAFWTSPHNPWQGIQDRWASLFGGLNGPGPATGLGFFGGNLELKGDITLPHTVVLHYVSDDPQAYLITQTYDSYDGHAWSRSTMRVQTYAAGQHEPSPPGTVRLINQTIILGDVGSGQRALFAADQPASFSIPNQVQVVLQGNAITAWSAQDDLVSGERYSAQSYLSTASADGLRRVPYPFQQGGGYPADVLNTYLKNPTTVIDPVIAQLAKQWSAGTSNMYDAASAIELHLRQFTYSLKNGPVPQNEDAVVWFLQNKHGFCTFFASALALMARSLGMPARIAEGFSNGEFDPAQTNYVVRGTDAHVWTQIYFAGYGWIDFEPTQTFNLIARASTSGQITGVTTTPGATTSATPRNGNKLGQQLGRGSSTPANTPVTSALRDIGVALAFLVAFLLLVVAAFVVYWRALYRNLPPVAGAFARVARLGTWSGIQPAPDQTPYEYTDALGRLVPAERVTLRRLSDLYVGERWGGVPAPADETVQLYYRARTALTRVIADRWRDVPTLLLGVRNRLRKGLFPSQRGGGEEEDEDNL